MSNRDFSDHVGRGIGRPLLEITDDDVDAMIRDNMKSALYGMQVVRRSRTWCATQP